MFDSGSVLGTEVAMRDGERRAPLRVVRRSLRLPAALAVAAALLPAVAAGAADPGLAASTSTPAPFVMCSDVTTVRIYEYHLRVYTEAFRRLGVPIEFAAYSLTRRAALAEEGTIDAEMARVRAYGDAHPRLVRVEEPVYDFAFSLYSGRPDLRVSKLDDLAGAPWSVEYRRGVLMCQRELEARVPRARVSDVATTEQGVRKLVEGRTDVYCDLEEFLEDVLARPEFKGSPVRRVLRFAKLPTYAYFGEKHAALAARVTAVLRQMRAEGLLERYLREATEGGPRD